MTHPGVACSASAFSSSFLAGLTGLTGIVTWFPVALAYRSAFR